jgi:hypothetical protein
MASSKDIEGAIVDFGGGEEAAGSVSKGEAKGMLQDCHRQS